MKQVNNIKDYLKIIEQISVNSSLFFRGQLEKYNGFPPTIARDPGFIVNENNIIQEITQNRINEFKDLDMLIKCCLTRKIQKFDKQNTKNKPPIFSFSAAFILNKRLCLAKYQNRILQMLKKQQSNSHIVEKYFRFCECCTISTVWEKM